MYKSAAALCLIIGWISFGMETTDTIRVASTFLLHSLPTKVITTTRTLKEAEHLTLPTTVISGREIENRGALTLGDLLGEELGMALDADHGTGLQLQGMGSDYTLILVDGEPVIGRTSGTLDLDRIYLKNIEQIEIVKGPSSSLYGSEALAGVINIITRPPGNKLALNSSLRYGGYQTRALDAGLESSIFRGNTVRLSLQNSGSEGYDLNENTLQPTAAPFNRYSGNLQVAGDADKKVRVKVNAAYSTTTSDYLSEIEEDGNDKILENAYRLNEWSVNHKFEYHPSYKRSGAVHLYLSEYDTDHEYLYREDGSEYEHTRFTQKYRKLEGSFHSSLGKRAGADIGGGGIREVVEAERIEGGEYSAYSAYGYGQLEYFIPKDKGFRLFNAVLSGRWDWHEGYGNHLSPKISASVSPLRGLKFIGCFATGFKAPEYRHFDLDWTNPSAGYSVFGTSYVEEGIERLEAEGQIASLSDLYLNVEPIRPEISNAYHLGFETNGTLFGAKLRRNLLILKTNAYINLVTDLIETQQIATKTNNQSVSTYFNLNRVFIYGVEPSLEWNPAPWLKFQGGYQYLLAVDMDVIDRIREGEIWTRTEAGDDRPVRLSEYGGLFNRSRHSGTFRAHLDFDWPEWAFSPNLRAVFRSPFGVADKNGNGILDAGNEYLEGYNWLEGGYVLLNSDFNVMRKKISSSMNLKVNLGVENIFDFTDAEFIATLPGRKWHGTISIHL